MPLVRTPSEVMDLRHAEYEARIPGGGEPPLSKNVRPLAWLTNPTRFPFRGRNWEVPPISATDGIRIFELLHTLDEFKRKAPDGSDDLVGLYATFLRESLKIIRRCLKPERGRLRRLFWRVRLSRNPWNTASDVEIGEILGFFWMCRTRSGDRRSNGNPNLELATLSTNGSTSSMRSDVSPGPIANGDMGSRS